MAAGILLTASCSSKSEAVTAMKVQRGLEAPVRLETGRPCHNIMLQPHSQMDSIHLFFRTHEEHTTPHEGKVAKLDQLSFF